MAEITAWVWIWGSSSRDVDWRNVAIVNPWVSGCNRRPSTRTRVVDPNRSKCSRVAVTAASWASSSRSSPVSAHHTHSDFGAENVASNPATARTTVPSAFTRSTSSRPSGDPDIGSRPSNNNCSASGVTSPASPNPAACCPTTPRAAPPAPPSDTGCSTRPSPPPTTRTESTPATSRHRPLPDHTPDRTPAAGGHLSVEHREVRDEQVGWLASVRS